ncbi:Protein-L-isoaspartate O-methyltransferase [hydrothermal vent metagenome]|uniref:protein-L-isoaspartate(D-aspartate) O-methyltransferase n=1 Tax=hydrothermal vent metagenome TaxID=652676 RepID=A0A3B1C2A0_9ZZZZ
MFSNKLAGIGMTSQRTRDRLIARLREEGIEDARVLDVMRTTPRHIFVDEALASRAYEDTALPIGYGQTISQPYIVARMSEILLNAGSRNKVLEIGTGSGYQTAVLTQLVEQVYTVERIPELLARAKKCLAELPLRNLHFQLGDGSWGWQQYAPYDGIMVTAAPEQVPKELLAQLAEGGRLVIPSGRADAQRLRLIIRCGDSFSETLLDRVSFVPLIKERRE